MVIFADSVVHLDEDVHNEFKMHAKMALSEIPFKCSGVDRGRVVRTMQPTSKTISAFLNTDGGRIFLGVDDEGLVKGIRMTRTVRDHFMLSLHYCLRRFTPNVPPELIKVQFEEVIDTDDEADRYTASDEDFGYDEFGDEKHFNDFFVSNHMIGGSRCDCQQSSTGIARSKLYLIVIQVLRDPNGVIYQNDEGLAYRRRHGSNKMLSIDDIRQQMEQGVIETERPSVWSSLKALLSWA